MAKRSGFAQVQRAMKTAAREADRSANARARERQAAVRRAEQARKAAERAAAGAARAAEADRRRAEKEAIAAHVAAMQAEVDERNAALDETYAEIDSLLAATLDIDDFVDLEQLRASVHHPPFSSSNEAPTQAPERLSPPPEPQLVVPPAPTGLGGLFGKKKHAEAVAAAEGAHVEAVRAWQAEVDSIPARQAEIDRRYAARFENLRAREWPGADDEAVVVRFTGEKAVPSAEGE